MTKVKTRPFMIFNSASGVFAIRQGKWKLIAGPGDGITPRSEIIHESGKTKPEFDPVTGKPIPFLYDWPPPRVPKESLPCSSTISKQIPGKR